MNPLEHKQAIQKTVTPKFRGQDTVKSKVVPHYPQSVEREYERIVSGYMGLYDSALRKHMPELKRSLQFYIRARFDAESIVYSQPSDARCSICHQSASDSPDNGTGF